MITTEAKTTASHHQPQTGQPFFHKERRGTFFSATDTDIQTKPFFTITHAASNNGFGKIQPGIKENSFTKKIQTKPFVAAKGLTIGQPNDPYEKEADAMADQVVQRLSEDSIQKKRDMPIFSITPFLQKKCEACEEEDKLQKKEDRFTQRKSEVEPVADNTFQTSLKTIIPPVTNPVSSIAPVQTKCAATEKENLSRKNEEEENQRESGLELQRNTELNLPDPPQDENNNTNTTINLKCEACEQEEKLQKSELKEEAEMPAVMTKSDENMPTDFSGLESQLSSSKGSGSPLSAPTRSAMETAFGTDFSKVNIHTDNQAVGMNKSLQAQAFTHGADIYFNEGKYNPASASGQHLLAHELTHVVQQNEANDAKTKNSPNQVSKKISDNGNSIIQRLSLEDLKYASPLYWNYRVTKWAGGKAWQGIQDVNEQFDSLTQSFLNMGKDEYYDIQGETAFSPGLTLLLYMLNYFERNRTNKVPVKIKYGSLGKGTIILEADNNYDFSTSGTYIIGIDHPALQVDTKQKALALEVNLSKNIITGKIGVPKGRNGDEIRENKDMPFISYGGFNYEALYPVIFGEAYDGKNFKTIVYENYLMGGYIKYLVGGYLDIEHQHKILSILSIVDDQYSWLGELDTHITGSETNTLSVERTPGGLLSAESDEMKLDGHWKGQGFTLDGGLHIVYSNKTIEIYGSAKYKSKRAEGAVNIAVLPESKAQMLFRQHVPAKNKEEVTGSKKGEETNFPNDPLALTAWGNFHFKLIDKAKKLSGDAAFAVSPEGYVVTAGQVKLQKDFILMDAQAKEYTLFEDEMSTKIYIGGVPVELSLRGDIKAGYRIGPIAMYELIATGTYSNHPDYASELCLGAKFEMPANLYIQLNLVAAAGISVGYKYLSITFVEVGGKLTGRADLNAYVNAKPSIGVRKEKDGEPEYCLSGKLYAGGELVVSLETGLEISVFRKIKTDSGGEDKKQIGKKDSFANWTLGNFGFELQADYTLGKDEKPEFTFSGGKFDKAGFLRAFNRKSKTDKAAKAKLKGGFEQEGEQKGIAGSESVKDKEISESDQPLGPFELVEDFKMNGTPHKLYLVVSGTEGNPDVKLEMASTREDLIEKINEEIAALEKINSSIWLIVSGELTEEQQKKIQMRINRLIRIREKAEKVKTSVTTKVADPATPTDIAAPGFEALDDEIGDFGDQFGVNDLGDTTGTVPTTDIPTDKPPEGVDIILVLPPQKAVHFRLYKKMVDQGSLQHSTEREERDTNQQTTWDNNIGSSMPRGTYCQGRGLGLTEADIFRPYWSKRYLDASRKSRKKPRESTDIPRMQVDHVIEWQVRPIAGAVWLDLPWNFELMDASSNGSSGPKMKGNIDKERERLAEKTGDNSWLTKDITFTIVTVEGSAAAERWSSEEIEDGDHLDTYRILTGEVNDPEKEKTC